MEGHEYGVFRRSSRPPRAAGNLLHKMKRSVTAKLLSFCFAVFLLMPSPTFAQEQSLVVDRVLDAKVFIWDTTAEGIGAMRAMQLARPMYDVGNIVVASSSPRVTVMTANGLSVEDRQGSLAPDGFWGEVRRGLTDYYANRGQKAIFSGRMVVEPEIAATHFQWYIDYNRPGGRPGTVFLHAHLLDVDYAQKYVLLRTPKGEIIKVIARVFLDASVEGDLSRKIGASYRFGMGEALYNSRVGPPPRPDVNRPETLIQRHSALLTLDVSGRASPLAVFRHPFYDHTTYHSGVWQSERNREAFARSWSIRHVLPNDKRELNESWSDYPDIAAVWSYIFDYDVDPVTRQRMRNQAITYVLNKVRYLNEHGYPEVGIANVPQRLYIREGIRVLGVDTLYGSEVEQGIVRDPVAASEYGLYDVHIHGVPNDHTSTRVYLPMGSLISAEFPDLLIPGPVSVDHRAFNGAVRMEWGKANRGAAAGMLAAIAIAKGVSPAHVRYEDVREELRRQGYANIP
jgi:hypothetical protein